MAAKKKGEGRNNVIIIRRREKQRVKGEERNRRFWLKIITNFQIFRLDFNEKKS